PGDRFRGEEGSMIRQIRRAALAASVCAAALAGAQAQEGTDERLDVEWPVYGGSLYAQHYSPLDQIDASNVANLRVAWRWSAANFGPRPEGRTETTPLMVGGVLYATAGITRNVIAIDARTGETLWMWRPNEGERLERAPRKISGRGGACWRDGAGDDGMCTVTPGSRLAGRDAKTGRPEPEFGDGGIVDMLAYVRGPLDDAEIGSTSPPLVVGDVIVVGPAHGVGARPRSMM